MSGRWNPLGAWNDYSIVTPPVGRLIAHAHAVWRVVAVTNLPVPVDEQAWIDAGYPDPDTWRERPYRVDLQWVGGARPADADPADGDEFPRAGWSITMPIGGTRYDTWQVYPPSERWPMCSCCGEPMPCRAELQDREVSKALSRVVRLESRCPGECWACGRPVRARQRAVVYPGENLDLPGGIEVLFHVRAACGRTARWYEARWLAADPRRERVLTYPDCAGALVVHWDGSTECLGEASSALGVAGQGAPDCRGHTTHDHTYLVACTAHDAIADPGCNCPTVGHGGAQPARRRPRRSPNLVTGAVYAARIATAPQP